MKRIAVLLAAALAMFLLPRVGIAQQAPATPETRMGPEPLGRLFFTPERRAVLERQRLTNVREAEAMDGVSMSLDGVVVRSSGKSTVWINGRAQNETDHASSGITARLSQGRPGKAVLSIGDDSPQSLKVGDAVNIGTQERQTIIGSGGIKVMPAPGKR